MKDAALSFGPAACLLHLRGCPEARSTRGVVAAVLADYVCAYACVYQCQVEDFIRDAEDALRGAEERNAAFASRQVGAFLAMGQAKGQRRGSGRRKEQQQEQEQLVEEAEEQQQQAGSKGRKGRKAGAPRRGAAAELSGSGGGNGNGMGRHAQHSEVEDGGKEGDERSEDALRAEVEAVRRQLEAVAAAVENGGNGGTAATAAVAAVQSREVTRVLHGGRRLTLQVGRVLKAKHRYRLLHVGPCAHVTPLPLVPPALASPLFSCPPRACHMAAVFLPCRWMLNPRTLTQSLSPVLGSSFWWCPQSPGALRGASGAG